MQQLEFFEIPSPCVGVCQTNANGYCKGCYRSRDERLHWLKLDDNAKRKVIKACKIRERKAKNKKSLSDPAAVEAWQADLPFN